MNIEDLRKQAKEEIAQTGTTDKLEELHIKYLGRKGALSTFLAEIPELPNQKDRRKAGLLINEVKNEIEAFLQNKDRELKTKSIQAAASSSFDITEPGLPAGLGTSHPLTQFREYVRDTFSKLGFEEVSAPHMESDEYNFALLNIPPDHPARQEHDTFYLPGERESPGGRARMVLRECLQRTWFGKQ